MRVGFTYDLKDDYLAAGFDKETCAEFDSIETIDAIDDFLTSRGCITERIGNLQSLTRMLLAGKRWDLVFNIAEGMYGRGREAQVPALLDAWQIPYIFSDPLVLALTLDKGLTKRVVRDAGLPTAAFCSIAEGEPYPSLPAFPLFVKPIAEGTGKGVTARSLVQDEKILQAAVADIHARFRQAAIVESYLPGREFTVGITGTGKQAQIIGVMEIHFLKTADSCGYTYDNKQMYEDRVRYEAVSDPEAVAAGNVALNAWRILECRDGGRVDIRSDAHHQPQFLEVNPLAGLHPVLGDLVILSKLFGVTYTELLSRILDSALKDASRFPSQKPPLLTAYA
jgi:D-alanine-D-alanine ligase